MKLSQTSGCRGHSAGFIGGDLAQGEVIPAVEPVMLINLRANGMPAWSGGAGAAAPFGRAHFSMRSRGFAILDQVPTDTLDNVMLSIMTLSGRADAHPGHVAASG
ncbi:hypothetical protein [Bradyrhizobium sp. CCBAU 51753]|uniref:hypothetical protein n=1 Tax=Bradyrhizobium sp. CCBAU 51753 TaxID=1325100 RepID=UPI00188B3991|nr:hypothetical protein [Bradyrhizobium sp. CCBAU 51753]